MPITPSPGTVRGKDPTDAANLDALDAAKTELQRHLTKYGCAAAPAKAAHYNRPDVAEEHHALIQARDEAALIVQEYRNE